MLFNSIQFVIYLPIVFLLDWFVFDRFISKSKHQLCLQNAFIVVASYVFCTYFDPDFNSKSRICSKIPSLDFSFVFFHVFGCGYAQQLFAEAGSLRQITGLCT